MDPLYKDYYWGISHLPSPHLLRPPINRKFLNKVVPVLPAEGVALPAARRSRRRHLPEPQRGQDPPLTKEYSLKLQGSLKGSIRVSIRELREYTLNYRGLTIMV